MLVSRVAREDDFVGVDIVFRGGGDVPGLRDTGAQSAKHHQAGDPETTSACELASKKKGAPERDRGIDQAKEHRRTNQSEPWHEQNGEQEGCTQRAEIIKRQNVRDDVAKMIAILHNAHQQWDFQADQNAHYDNKGVKNEFEALREGKRQHQKRRRKAANHAEEQLNPHEAVYESAMDVAGECAANSHGEEVSADDR